MLFDFGGVLVPAPFAVFARLERDGGLPPGLVRSINSRNPDTNAWARLERGEVDVDGFCTLFAAEAADLGAVIDPRAVIEPILGLGAAEHRVVPEMLAAVHACRAAGVRVALITNNAVPLADGGDSAWVFDTFDAVIESCRTGTRKPEPAMYRLALDALDVTPGRAAMLDDLGINLRTARELGMTTIKVVDPVAAAHELTALLALPAA